jgi:uncharacterized membrane protein
MNFLKLYTIAIPIFFAIDMLWLGIVAKQFYRNQIGALLKPDVNWIAAMIFYFVFIAGITVFVTLPAITKHSLRDALVYGALFGFVCYATYDLTNLAVAKDWPLLVTIVDLIWGSVLTATVASCTYLIAQKIL